LPELVEAFDLYRLNKAGATFDLAKLDWMNGYYIRQLAPDDLARRLLLFLEQAGLATPDQLPYVERLVPLVQERLRVLAEAPDLLAFCFTDELEYRSEDLIAKGLTAESSRRALLAALELLRTTPDFADEALEAALRAMADQVDVKHGQLFMILRIAVTGRKVSPPLTASMEAISRERTVERVEEAVRRLDRLIEARVRA
jgi:glutamyl-tRNA synthetase